MKNQHPVLPGMFSPRLDLRTPAPDPPLNLPAAKVARNDALATVSAHAPEGFQEEALLAVRQAAAAHDTLIVDDVWTYLGSKPFEARAIGPVMARARALGIIAPTNEFRASAQPQCHANPRRVWRSLVRG